jgi:hypothetical protein
MKLVVDASVYMKRANKVISMYVERAITRNGVINRRRFGDMWLTCTMQLMQRAFIETRYFSNRALKRERERERESDSIRECIPESGITPAKIRRAYR